ncbi:MAG: ThiF family adenylyltransferase [Gemmatimonadaceae bacterium]|nr:ThiF family adenylyltransferase [Gemmatimonadaceae bacterium]
MNALSFLRRAAGAVSTALFRLLGRHPEGRRLEIAWSVTTRETMVGVALAASPREGAVVAYCRSSTACDRDTLIVQDVVPPIARDLSYHRGPVVTVTSHYWNRVIDGLAGQGPDTGLAVLHTHPGFGVPMWSSDDDRADDDLARFLFGEGFLQPEAPLISIVASMTDIRARVLRFDRTSAIKVSMTPVERIRTLGPSRIQFESTTDRLDEGRIHDVPAHADRSVRVFGREGQRLLADLHIAVVGNGGVGSICTEHVARWGIGRISCWDLDIVKDVNVNRSAIITFADAKRKRSKAERLARALPAFSLVRDIRVRWSVSDVRDRAEIAHLLSADIILMLVDDPRPRHFINRLAYAHYIPVLDGGNAIRSTAEDDPSAEDSMVEAGGIRINYLTPDGPCLWCAGHLTSERLALAFRPDYDMAADRARGYVEGLGPAHAPSVMPVNSLTAALLEIRLQDLLFGLSNRNVPEVYYDLLGGTLDELPRLIRSHCPQCMRWLGLGDGADLPFRE